MSEQKPLVAKIALTCVGAATLQQPDRVNLVFDEPVLRAIAKALAVLGAMHEIGTQLTLPLADTNAFFRGGRPWPATHRDSGNFVVSSLWMHVEAERLHIEVWESCCDDELHGFVEFAEMPALLEAVERHRHWSEEAVLQGLCVTPHETEDAAPIPTPLLVHALRLAEPWLVKLGDYIGNGTPEDPMGRCTALLAVRRALGRTRDWETAAAQAGTAGAGTADHH